MNLEGIAFWPTRDDTKAPFMSLLWFRSNVTIPFKKQMSVMVKKVLAVLVLCLHVVHLMRGYGAKWLLVYAVVLFT